MARWRWQEPKKLPIYRYDPVPHTGGFGGQCGNFIYRGFHTFQERRDWKYFRKLQKDVFHHYGVWIKTGRAGSELPEPWDDIRHSTDKRCWKRTRVRRQWQKNSK